MNTTFKLGKVSIPVDLETGATIEIEGIEISMSDLNLKEFTSALKELPGIMKNIRLAMEEDIEDMFDDEEDEPFMSDGFEAFLQDLAKAKPFKPDMIPAFKKSENPLESMFGKPKSLSDLMKEQQAPKHPFEAFLDKKAEEAKSEGIPESLKKLLASQGIDTDKVKIINGSLQDMMGLFDKGPKF